MHRLRLTVVVVALAVTACTSGPTDRAAPPPPPGSVGPEATTTTSNPPESTTTTTTTTTATVPEPVWVVGARPLPLRPDGLGEVLPTPEVLVDRSLPTASALPPPTGPGFESSVGPVDDDVLARMGPTWSPGCPVHHADLAYVTVTFVGFDGDHHTGELVVDASVARDLVGVFERLFDARFPIEEMRLITGADLDAAPTGDGNNTAAFVCRPMRGGTTWSEHAYGLAIDVNPFHNPYVRGDPGSPNRVVIPELASAYLDRGWDRPGMIQPGDVVTEAFAAIGWTWGGGWSSPDLMHFSRGGR